MTHFVNFHFTLISIIEESKEPIWAKHLTSYNIAEVFWPDNIQSKSGEVGKEKEWEGGQNG